MSVTAPIEEIIAQSRWATTVGKVCDQFGGEVQTGPFGSQLHASDYSEDGTPVIMPQDMVDGKIVCDRIARVGPKHVSQLKRHMLRVGDVVYSRRGDVTRLQSSRKPRKADSAEREAFAYDSTSRKSKSVTCDDTCSKSQSASG